MCPPGEPDRKPTSPSPAGPAAQPYLCLWWLFAGWVTCGPSLFCRNCFSSFWFFPVELWETGGAGERQGERAPYTQGLPGRGLCSGGQVLPAV